MMKSWHPGSPHPHRQLTGLAGGDRGSDCLLVLPAMEWGTAGAEEIDSSREVRELGEATEKFEVQYGKYWGGQQLCAQCYDDTMENMKSKT